ncbi:MAG: GNAT family N-acetyltransferase [Comamonas sp.]
MPSPSVIVRSIAAAELPQLLALYAHLHADDDPLPAAEVVDAVWQELLASPRHSYWGAFVQGDGAAQLVATCTLTVVPNLTRGCKPYGLIENVVTHGAHRGAGHGKAVLDAALQHAWSQGCYKVMLMTGRKDAATLGFYASAGLDGQTKRAFIAQNPALSAL